MKRRLDRFGFPIPAEFEPPVGESETAGTGRVRPAAAGGTASRRRPSVSKRWFLLAALLCVVLPTAVGPQFWPLVRDSVVLWSLERAVEREARGDLGGAIAAIGLAVRWHGDDADLLCKRAMLRLENRDAHGAVDDAAQAAALVPASATPRRVRALVHVVLGDADRALSDAESAVQLSAAGDPEALNHRAYIRALLGRDLQAALEDIDRAITSLPEPQPEMLDTRGFVLHLLGRQDEALDTLNVAIDGMQKSRRIFARAAGRLEEAELACRLRRLDQGMAVMLHHRAAVCRAKGLEEQAEQDFDRAEKLGFDPSRGIF